MVREEGLEPTRPKTPGPKPGASANSATLALKVSEINNLDFMLVTSQIFLPINLQLIHFRTIGAILYKKIVFLSIESGIRVPWFIVRK